MFAVAGMLQVSPEDLGAALTSDVQYFKGVHCTLAPNQVKTYADTVTQGNSVLYCLNYMNHRYFILGDLTLWRAVSAFLSFVEILQ